MLLDELSFEASSAKINAPNTHKPLLEPKNSLAIGSSATITAFSSIASESRFPAHLIETDVTAIARLALINFYIKYPLSLKIYPLVLNYILLGKWNFILSLWCLRGPWKLYLVGVDTGI